MKTKSFKAQGNHTDRKFTIYFTGPCAFKMYSGYHMVVSFLLNPFTDDTISNDKVLRGSTRYYKFDYTWFMFAKLKYTIELKPIDNKNNFDADIEWKG